MALHKTNIYIDISGWSPRRIPAEVVHEIGGRLTDRFVWGSDFPFLTPERCLDEITTLGLSGPALDRLLYTNAARILGIERSG
jgi:predicted TIM-barrel fold metal-dependent hydrolase